jgi:hypothetical protein
VLKELGYTDAEIATLTPEVASSNARERGASPPRPSTPAAPTSE